MCKGRPGGLVGLLGPHPHPSHVPLYAEGTGTLALTLMAPPFSRELGWDRSQSLVRPGLVLSVPRERAEGTAHPVQRGCWG